MSTYIMSTYIIMIISC